MFDETTDNYLVAIYRAHLEARQALRGVDLATTFGVTPATVANKLKRLARARLISRGPGRAFALTETGRARAEALVRRQRLAQCLLANQLGVPWEKVTAEADLLKHAITRVAEAYLIEFLGKPRRSPFGYPIPGLDATPLSPTPLSSVVAGATATIERIDELDADLLSFCVDHGLVPGARVSVKAVERGSQTVEVALADGQRVALGTAASERIWVEAGDTASRATGDGIRTGPRP